MSDFLKDMYTIEELDEIEKTHYEKQALEERKQILNYKKTLKRKRRFYEMEFYLYLLTIKYKKYDSVEMAPYFPSDDEFITLYLLPEEVAGNEKIKIYLVLLPYHIFDNIAHHFNWNLEKQLEVIDKCVDCEYLVKMANMCHHQNLIAEIDEKIVINFLSGLYIKAITEKRYFTKKEIIKEALSINWDLEGSKNIYNVDYPSWNKCYSELEFIRYGIKMFIDFWKQNLMKI